jgi:hypothetical protein
MRAEPDGIRSETVSDSGGWAVTQRVMCLAHRIFRRGARYTYLEGFSSTTCNQRMFFGFTRQFEYCLKSHLVMGSGNNLPRAQSWKASFKHTVLPPR